MASTVLLRADQCWYEEQSARALVVPLSEPRAGGIILRIGPPPGPQPQHPRQIAPVCDLRGVAGLAGTLYAQRAACLTLATNSIAFSAPWIALARSVSGRNGGGRICLHNCLLSKEPSWM